MLIKYLSTLEAFTQQGWRLIPIENKIPKIVNWQSDNTNVNDKILTSIKSGTMQSCGLTIPRSFLVVDIDLKNIGGSLQEKESLEQFIGFSLNDTFTVKTQSGGFHHIFRIPDNAQYRKKVNDRWPNIDFLTYGCYIVALGSVLPINPSNTVHPFYEIINFVPIITTEAFNFLASPVQHHSVRPNIPEQVAVSSVPLDIAKFENYLKILVTNCPPVAIGGRNEQLYRIAQQALDLNVPMDYLYTKGYEKLQGWFIPPLDQKEFISILEHAPKYRVDPIGTKSVAVTNPEMLDLPISTQIEIEAKSLKTQGGFNKNCRANLAMWFEKNPRLLTAFRYNTRTNMVDPWKIKELLPNYKVADGNLIPQAQTALSNYLSINYGIDPSKAEIKDQINLIALSNAYDPLQDRIKNTQWDGKERIKNFFTHYQGLPEDTYMQSCSELFFGGLINRIFEPGFKFDIMFILKGDQGLGKSTIFKLLIGEEYYFASKINIDDPERYVTTMKYAAIIEFQEFRMNFTESEKMKAFITTTVDKARILGGNDLGVYPRHCVLVGTTNDPDGIFYDPTGSRRFLLVDILSHVHFDRVEQDADQLLAEAFVKKDRLPIKITPASTMYKIQQAKNNDIIIPDMVVLSYQEAIESKLASCIKDGATLATIMELLMIPIEKRNKEQRKVTRALRDLGYSVAPEKNIDYLGVERIMQIWRIR